MRLHIPKKPSFTGRLLILIQSFFSVIALYTAPWIKTITERSSRSTNRTQGTLQNMLCITCWKLKVSNIWGLLRNAWMTKEWVIQTKFPLNISFIFLKKIHIQNFYHIPWKRGTRVRRGVVPTILTFPQNLVITVENKVCHLENVHNITETEV